MFDPELTKKNAARIIRRCGFTRDQIVRYLGNISIEEYTALSEGRAVPSIIQVASLCFLAEVDVNDFFERELRDEEIKTYASDDRLLEIQRRAFASAKKTDEYPNTV